MTARTRLRTALPFLAGAATALGVARLFGPRAGPDGNIGQGLRDPFGAQGGRGERGTPANAAAVAAGYETDDANARLLGRVMLLFAVSAVSGIGLMVLLLGVLDRRDVARDTGLTAMQRLQSPPPLPHMQADPVAELAALQARQARLLDGYATLDGQTARIPIGRAMQLVAGQSLDAHAAPERPAAERTR